MGDHIRKRRLDLGLLQKDVAKILGVTEASVFYWETHRASPRGRYIPRIIEFLGYLPEIAFH
ncbi:MAG: helix-turn-helix domain-containing protein [Armatimonadota bacterium]